MPVPIRVPARVSLHARATRPARGVPLPVHVRLLQQHRAEESARADRGLSPRIRRRRTALRSCSRASTARLASRSSSCFAPRRPDRPDIVIIDRYVSAEERSGMMAACDCYASLHRSEGLRADDGRGHGARQAGRRNRLVGQPRVHVRRDRVSRALRDDQAGARPRPLPGGRGVGGARSRSRRRADARVFDEREAAAAHRRTRAEVDRGGSRHGATAAFLRATPRGDRQSTGEPRRRRRRTPPLPRARQWLATADSRRAGGTGSRRASAPPGVQARRAMLRAIQPYTRRQAMLDRLLVEAAVESQVGVGRAAKTGSLTLEEQCAQRACRQLAARRH